MIFGAFLRLIMIQWRLINTISRRSPFKPMYSYGKLFKKTLILFKDQSPLNQRTMKLRCLGAVLLIVVDILSTLLVAYYSKKVVDSFVLSWVNGIWISTSLLGFFWILETSTLHLQDIIFFPIINQTIRNLSYKTVDHIHQISLLEYEQLSISEIINCIRRISQSARSFIKIILLILIPSTLKIMIAVSTAIHHHLFCLILVPLLSVAFFILYKGTLWYSQTRSKAWEVSDQVIRRLNDSLLNSEACRFFKDQEMQHIDGLLDDEAACWQKTNIRLHGLHLLIGALLGFSLLAALVSVISAIHHGTLSMGDFIFLKSQLLAAFLPFRNFSREFRQISESLVDVRRILELLEIPSLKKEGIRIMHGEKPGIDLKNMSFAYPQGPRVFNQVSLRVPLGLKTGIIGPNGSGKSTLLKIMSGLYQPTQGEIYIQAPGYSVSIPNHLLIHYIPQHYRLFNLSLRENMTLGIGFVADPVLKRVLEEVKLDTLLEQLPQGLDSIVGEMGTKLSGGEKQKIALARALLVKPFILLLDETTNALSIEHESQILDCLFDKIPTIILSSHRSSTHKKLDQILTITQGTVQQSPDLSIPVFEKQNSNDE